LGEEISHVDVDGSASTICELPSLCAWRTKRSKISSRNKETKSRASRNAYSTTKCDHLTYVTAQQNVHPPFIYLLRLRPLQPLASSKSRVPQRRSPTQRHLFEDVRADLAPISKLEDRLIMPELPTQPSPAHEAHRDVASDIVRRGEVESFVRNAKGRLRLLG
jgi:hypothetical protein